MKEIFDKLLNVLIAFDKKIDSVLVSSFLNHLLTLACIAMLIIVLIVK